MCALMVMLGLARAEAQMLVNAALPEAPSSILVAAQQQAGQAPAPVETEPPPTEIKKTKVWLCTELTPGKPIKPGADGKAAVENRDTCLAENPLQTIVSTKDVKPLDAGQKFRLAVKDFKDPFGLGLLTLTGGIYIASNAHNPYGPGLKGFGRITGYNLVQAAQGEFFATFAIPALAHEDPRYHRMGGKNIGLRVLHAAAHTYVSQHDDGRLMPNYATMGNYVIGAELANLWIPGSAVDASSTAKRIALGIALDPTGQLIGEFLPDIAKHINVHIVFVQGLINRAVYGPNGQNQ